MSFTGSLGWVAYFKVHGSLRLLARTSLQSPSTLTLPVLQRFRNFTILQTRLLHFTTPSCNTSLRVTQEQFLKWETSTPSHRTLLEAENAYPLPLKVPLSSGSPSRMQVKGFLWRSGPCLDWLRGGFRIFISVLQAEELIDIQKL